MRSIPLRVRWKILLRSFAIQGSWNYQTLIGTGFAFTVLPALRYLYGADREKLQLAVARHLELFNSHPYLATVAIGAVTRLEADGVDAAVIERFKTALRGSLGSLGDRLVWTTWRPMAALAAIFLALAGVAWWVTVLFFLVLYNLMHLTIRFVGLKAGLETGLEVGRVLRAAPIQPIIHWASQVGCVLAGGALVLAIAPTSGDPLALLIVAASLAIGFRLGARTRNNMVVVLIAIAAVALLLGLAGHGA